MSTDTAMVRRMKVLGILASVGVVGVAALAGWALWPRLVRWYTAPPFVTEKLIGLGMMFGIAILVGFAAYFIALREPSA